MPPEFRPGTKWEYRDPNKLAEDPNATPSTVKPSFLPSNGIVGAFGPGKPTNDQMFDNYSSFSANNNVQEKVRAVYFMSGLVFSIIKIGDDVLKKRCTMYINAVISVILYLSNFA